MPLSVSQKRPVQSRKGLALFIVLSLLSGWIGLLIDYMLPEQPDEQTLGMGVWLILPFLTGIFLRAVKKDWADFGIRPRLSGNVRLYGLSIFIFPLFSLVFILAGWLLGRVEFYYDPSVSVLPLIISMTAGLFVKNIFEDFAWQGYLMPKVASLGVKDLAVYLTVGLVWAFWHAPYYLYFLPDTFYTSQLNRLMDTFVTSPVVITVWAVIFVEMTRLTRSVWPAVLMHTIEDAVPNFLIFEAGLIRFEGWADWLLNPLNGILPLGLYLIFGLWLRKQRIKQESLSPSLRQLHIRER